MPIAMSIADVERDTGLSKDTLRVWERRYGFPRPRRDALGERTYAPAQVEKLRVIKRMIDAEKSDLYDVLAYIAFAMAPITREERVNTHKAQIFSPSV